MAETFIPCSQHNPNMYIKYNFLKGVTMFCAQCEQTIRTPAGNGCSYAQECAVKQPKRPIRSDPRLRLCKVSFARAVKAREWHH